MMFFCSPFRSTDRELRLTWSLFGMSVAPGQPGRKTRWNSPKLTLKLTGCFIRSKWPLTHDCRALTTVLDKYQDAQERGEQDAQERALRSARMSLPRDKYTQIFMHLTSSIEKLKLRVNGRGDGTVLDADQPLRPQLGGLEQA